MTDIPPTKTIAVLGARPTDRTAALRTLALRLAATGLRPVPVHDGAAADTGPAGPTLDQLRRADWSTAFDTVVDACARERRARARARPPDVLLVGGLAVRALACYRVGLALRGDEFDPAVRAWLEGPVVGAAAGYDAVLHIRPAAPVGRADRLVDRELAAVLDRLPLPPGAIFVAPLCSDVRHSIQDMIVGLTGQGVPTSFGCGCRTG
jgi:hypothetical protein